MDMSHLYNDAYLNDPIVELDVREQMRTKEVNAREERNFERQSKSFERAKNICERNTTWERWKVGQTLHTIWERTPRLEKSLAVEKARVESLQRALLARTYRQNFGDLPQIIYPKSPQAQPSARLSIDRAHRFKRGRGKQRKDKKKEGRPLNTDFSLDRHLQRQADFIKRSEHVVKALARLNWRQESRKRDHEKFKEELIEFSKPVMDRARMVLKGRQDMDVDQFLDEFQDYLLQKNSKQISGSMTSLASKNSQSVDAGYHHQRLTRGNVLRLENAAEESLGFLPSVAATSSTDLTVIDVGDGKDIDNDNVDNDNFTLTRDDNNGEEAGDVTVATTEVATDLSRLSLAENIDNSAPLLVRRHTGYNDQKSNDDNNTNTNTTTTSINNNNSYSNKDNSNTFHLPSIHDSRTATTERPRRRHTASDNHMSSVTGLGGTSPTNSKSSSTSNDIFTPSTSVSQVIIEEEEGEDEEGEDEEGEDEVLLGSTSSYHHLHHYNFNTQQRRRSSFFDDDEDDDDENGEKPYALTCTVGLPQLWKQPVKQQKEKAAPEISPSAIARKHRRKRNSQRML